MEPELWTETKCKMGRDPEIDALHKMEQAEESLMFSLCTKSTGVPSSGYRSRIEEALIAGILVVGDEYIYPGGIFLQSRFPLSFLIHRGPSFLSAIGNNIQLGDLIGEVFLERKQC